MNSLKKEARAAGLLYLLGALVAPFGLMYVPVTLIVRGDAAATADNIRASETLLRMGIASEMSTAVIFIFVALALYHLLKRVSEKHALMMATLILISVPISLLNVLNNIAALYLVGGADYLSVFDRPQLDALAYVFLRLHGQGIVVLASIFWGLWLLPFGVLVIRSGFIPRVLGVLLIIAGSGYVVSAPTWLLLPQYVERIDQFTTILGFGEVPIVFWLVVWGVKTQRVDAPAS